MSTTFTGKHILGIHRRGYGYSPEWGGSTCGYSPSWGGAKNVLEGSHSSPPPHGLLPKMGGGAHQYGGGALGGAQIFNILVATPQNGGGGAQNFKILVRKTIKIFIFTIRSTQNFLRASREKLSKLPLFTLRTTYNFLRSSRKLLRVF